MSVGPSVAESGSASAAEWAVMSVGALVAESGSTSAAEMEGMSEACLEAKSDLAMEAPKALAMGTRLADT